MSLTIAQKDRSNQKILAARWNYIDLGLFPSFNPNDLLAGQPYPDKIFDWSIVKIK